MKVCKTRGDGVVIHLVVVLVVVVFDMLDFFIDRVYNWMMTPRRINLGFGLCCFAILVGNSAMSHLVVREFIAFARLTCTQ